MGEVGEILPERDERGGHGGHGKVWLPEKKAPPFFNFYFPIFMFMIRTNVSPSSRLRCDKVG